MKKSLVLSLMFFLGLTLTACEDANSNSDLGSLSEKVDSQNSGPQNSTFSTGWGFKISVESDLVSTGNGSGCYTVNVRVYLTDMSTGQKELVANDNVKVGDGCPKKAAAKTEENRCESGYLPNGDYVMASELSSDYRECLKDYLTTNEEAYGLYLASTRELINSL